MPDGPGLVLLLHGFTHTGNSWQPVLDALGRGQRALAPDLAGHGTASEGRPANLNGVITDLAGLMSSGTVVAGYSMGGRLALHLALDQPERTRHLVLIGASPGLADSAEREARRHADDELAGQIERSSIEEFASRWATTPVLSGLPPSLAARVHQDRLRSTPAGLARALRGLGTGALPSLWGRLGELTMPVTLVAGERDNKFQDIAREMAASLQQAEVVVVPGTGHAVHLEAPRRVAEVISGATEGDPR
jgi:2-succinyl-6-hydroxy-2,4-cyclohexadiene-1-carboxylate synthase